MASYDDTLRTTLEILRKHVTEGRAISPGDHIQNDLGLDSLSVMEVVADIEGRFAVDIPTEMLAELATVDDVARALVQLNAS